MNLSKLILFMTAQFIFLHFMLAAPKTKKVLLLNGTYHCSSLSDYSAVIGRIRKSKNKLRSNNLLVLTGNLQIDRKTLLANVLVLGKTISRSGLMEKNKIETIGSAGALKLDKVTFKDVQVGNLKYF